MDTIDPRDFGRLEALVETMGREIGELKIANASLSTKMDKVLDTLSENRGGWKTMVWLGGAFISAGSAFGWVLEHLLRR